MCNNGHANCIGPDCTLAAVPNRPLIGKARVLADFRAAIQTALKGRQPVKVTSSSVVYQWYSPYTALEAARDLQTTLQANVGLFSTTLEVWTSPDVGHATLTVRYKMRKV